MWQRIQTVFLVILVIALIGSILLPIWALGDGERNFSLYALHYVVSENGVKTSHVMPYAITGILFVAAITIAIIEIGKYKDRFTQIKLGTLNSLILVGGYGSAVYFATKMVEANQGAGDYGLGLWLPAVAVLCNWLAMRFIRRDEKIVRDSQRLR